jgi:hypothetical protein
MKKRTHWAWKVYFSIFSIGALLNLILLLSGESSASQYYQILIAFRQSYLLYDYLYALNVIVNTLSLIPFFLFVFRIRLFPPFIWQILFIARIFFFFTGHSYEWQTLRAFIRTDPLTTVIAGAVFIFFTLPSYIACFHYAFKSEKIFS